MPARRRQTAAVLAVRRLLGEVYASDLRYPDLDTLCERYSDMMPLDRQMLVCWHREDDWEGQRRALAEQPTPDLEARRIERHLEQLRTLSKRAGLGMRMVRPRSHEQMMQVQLKCIELTAQMEARLAERKAERDWLGDDHQQADEDDRTSALSDDAKAQIARIVLMAGADPGTKDKEQGGQDAADD